MAQIDRDVWFFLIKAQVTGKGTRSLAPGSRSYVQCFVPGQRLEDCLLALDAYLPSEQLRRIDTLRATRFDADGEDEKYPGDFFRKALEEAASLNRCTLGIFIASDDEAPPTIDVH